MSNNNSNQKIIIIGAGLVGTLLGIFFAKRNYNVYIYEQRKDLRKSNIKEGRSINLTMGVRAWKALEEAGVNELISKITIPLYKRVIHNEDGTLSRQPYGIKKQAIHAICRFDLNCILLNMVEAFKNVHLYFQKKCVNLDLNFNKISFKDISTKAEYSIEGDLIIGADGAYSRIRGILQKTSMFNYSQHYMDYGYKELFINPGKNKTYLLDKNGFHIWARGNYMLIASPNLHGAFTATIFLPFKDSKNSFEKLNNNEKLYDFFNEHFSDVVSYIPNLEKQFFSKSPTTMISIKCSPWIYEDKILLIGDSAHAIPPFYGQGMNSAFEDCRIFIELIDRYKANWSEILPRFQDLRIPNTNALSELTFHNFAEIRDHIAKPQFLFRKKIEAEIQQQYPDKWKPLYTMVAFTHMPYAEVLEQGKKQKAIIDKVVEMVDIEKKWQKIDYSTLINFNNLTWAGAPVFHKEYC